MIISEPESQVFSEALTFWFVLTGWCCCCCCWTKRRPRTTTSDSFSSFAETWTSSCPCRRCPSLIRTTTTATTPTFRATTSPVTSSTTCSSCFASCLRSSASLERTPTGRGRRRRWQRPGCHRRRLEYRHSQLNPGPRSSRLLGGPPG